MQFASNHPRMKALKIFHQIQLLAEVGCGIARIEEVNFSNKLNRSLLKVKFRGTHVDDEIGSCYGDGMYNVPNVRYGPSGDGYLIPDTNCRLKIVVRSILFC